MTPLASSSKLRRALLGLLLAPCFAALAQPPQRELLVEVRQSNGSDNSVGTVATQDSTGSFPTQRVFVMNGEKASVRLSRSVPMKWTRSASSPGAYAGAASGPGAAAAQGGVVNQVTWMSAGQSLSVHPVWPGGTQDVLIEVEARRAEVDERVGAALPEQRQSEVSTKVKVALGRWVTIASSGDPTVPGTYGTNSGTATMQLLQIRVTAP